MMRRTISTVLAMGAVCVLAIPARAQDWANWRGPNYNGSTVAKNLPVTFSQTENVKWVADLPGSGASSPIIFGDSVFVSAADAANETLVALCLDRKTGKVKWRHAVGSGYRPNNQGNKIRLDERSDYASPSPVTDGKRVVFFFGNGDLAAFDFSGKKLWQRNIQQTYGDFAFGWTFSSSPQLFAGKLYLQILQRNQPVAGRGKPDAPSFLLALNPDTGAELWKAERPSPAVMESREAFTTPIPYQTGGRKELVVAGGDVVTGHDPETGKELWRWGTWNESHREAWWRLVPSPVVGNNVVLVCAPKRAPVYAAKLGGKGDLGATGLAWKSEERGPVTSDVPTPAFYNGNFYVVSDVRKSVSCVDARTGKVIWTVAAPGREKHWASPVAVDGKVYLFNTEGTVQVLDAATGKLLAENALDVPGADTRSTPAIAHGNLYVRTSNKLYCLGK